MAPRHARRVLNPDGSLADLPQENWVTFKPESPPHRMPSGRAAFSCIRDFQSIFSWHDTAAEALAVARLPCADQLTGSRACSQIHMVSVLLTPTQRTSP